MRKSTALIIAVTLSGLLLVFLAGGAAAATGPVVGPVTTFAPALIPAVSPTTEPTHQISAKDADDLVRQREAAYQAQLDELTRRNQAGQERVAALASQEQALNNQLAQLEQTRQARGSVLSEPAWRLAGTIQPALGPICVTAAGDSISPGAGQGTLGPVTHTL